MKLNNIIYSPSKITKDYWVYCKENHIAKQYPNNDGKWMMFFPLDELDQRWNEACGLFRAGKLRGVNTMKVSTAKPNPKAIYKSGEGILIFYCGPSENREKVLEYGRNILTHMNYTRAYFFYKSDKPHLIRYENAYKHLYFIKTLDFYTNRYTNQTSQSKATQMTNNVNVRSQSAYTQVLTSPNSNLKSTPTRIVHIGRRPASNIVKTKNVGIDYYDLNSFNYTDTVADVQKIIQMKQQGRISQLKR